MTSLAELRLAALRVKARKEGIELDTLGFLPPHDGQRQVLESPAQFNVVCCGRRWGKTELAMRLLAEKALQGLPVAYVIPTYPMLTEVWRTLSERLQSVTTRAVVSENRIELRGGGIIDLWSAEGGADRMRGRKYARVVVDEAAMVPGLIHTWEYAIVPTLTDLQGDAWFPSTPRRGGGFEELYRLEETDPEWRTFHMPSWTNPHLPADWIEQRRLTLSPAAFDQEYGAEIEASESDLVFPEFKRAIHVAPAPCSWKECKYRIAGIDPGGGDPTAIVMLGVDSREHVHQYGEFYRRGDVAMDDVVAYISQWEGRLSFVAIDPSAKGWTATLRQYGINAVVADNSRESGLEIVRWFLSNHRLTIGENCPESINEFAQYRWAKKRDQETGDRYATRAANDHHADAMDARRYALVGLMRALPSANRAPARELQRSYQAGRTRP